MYGHQSKRYHYEKLKGSGGGGGGGTTRQVAVSLSHLRLVTDYRDYMMPQGVVMYLCLFYGRACPLSILVLG